MPARLNFRVSLVVWTSLLAPCILIQFLSHCVVAFGRWGGLLLTCCDYSRELPSAWLDLDFLCVFEEYVGFRSTQSSVRQLFEQLSCWTKALTEYLTGKTENSVANILLYLPQFSAYFQASKLKMGC